eukprot:6466940-Amphidinium_carterae.2
MACLCSALTHILPCVVCRTCAGSIVASSSSTAHMTPGEALLGSLRVAPVSLLRMYRNFVAATPIDNVAEPHIIEAVTPARAKCLTLPPARRSRASRGIFLYDLIARSCILRVLRRRSKARVWPRCVWASALGTASASQNGKYDRLLCMASSRSGKCCMHLFRLSLDMNADIIHHVLQAQHKRDLQLRRVQMKRISAT